MLEYDYECTNCEAEFTVEQRVSDKPKKKCPLCNKVTLQRIITSAPLGFVKQDAKTLGQLAERNEKKFGKDEVKERRALQEEDRKRAIELKNQRAEARLPKGMSIRKPGKSKIAELPSHIKTAVNTGDKSRIDKYVMEGR